MPREMNFLPKKGTPWENSHHLIRYPANSRDEDVPFDSAQKSTLPQKELRILNPKPIPNAKQKMGPRQLSAPEKVVKPVYEPIPHVELITTELDQSKPDKNDNLEAADHTNSVEVTAGPKLKPDKPKPAINPMLAVGLTSNVVAVGPDEICFGSGSVLVVMDMNCLTQKCLNESDSDISAVALAQHVIVTGSRNGSIRFWKEEKCFLMLKTSVQAQFLKTIGKFLVVCGRSTKVGSSFTAVSIWDLSRLHSDESVTELCRGSTDQVVHALEAPQEGAGQSEHAIRFCTGGINGVRMWRVRKQNHLRSAPVDFQKHACTEICAMSWNGEFLLAAGSGGTIFRIDSENLKVIDLHQLLFNQSPTAISALFSIGSHLVVGSENGTVRVWSRDLSEVKIEVGLKGKIRQIASTFDWSAKSCLISTASKSVGLLEIDQSKYRTLYRCHSGEVLFCALSGDLVVTAGVSDLRVSKLRHLADSSALSLVQIFELTFAPNEISSLALFQNKLAIGHSSGLVKVFEIDEGDSKPLLDRQIHRGSVTDVHFSQSEGVMFSTDCLGDLAVYNSQFSISRVVKDGTFPTEGNRIASSPEGRFIAVLSSRSKSSLQIYSSQLDPLTQLPFDNSAELSNWCFVDNSNLLVLTADRSVYQYSISAQKCVLRRRDVHYTNSAIFLASISKSLTFTASKDSLKCWPANMKKEKPQEFLVHRKINALSACDQFLLSVGDVVVLWKSTDVFTNTCRPDTPDVLVYETEKVELTEPSGALFSAIEVFDQSLASDLLPRSEMAPSPIMRTDDDLEKDPLNITPIDPDSDSERCSSPILPEVRVTHTTAHTDHAQTSSLVKIMKHCDISRHFAKEISLPRARAFPKSVPGIPSELFLPKAGEEAAELVRTVSYHSIGQSDCIWADKRGELIYSSGGLVVQENILTSKQKIISNRQDFCPVDTMALSFDQSRLVFSQLQPSFSSLLNFVDFQLENEVQTLAHQHEKRVHCLDISKDNRWIVSISGDFDSSIEVHASWNLNSVAFNKYKMIINDAKFAAADLFITVGDELRYWEISSDEITTYDVELANELRDSLLCSLALSADFSTMALGSQSGLVSIWSLSGFQLKYFFAAGEGEINRMALSSGDRLVLSRDKRIQFWDISGKSDISDVKFKLEHDFELDDYSFALTVSGNQAVVGTSGAIYYLSPEGSNGLIGSTAGLTDLAQHGNYLATSHSNGSVKLWQPNPTRSWHLVVQFLAQQAANCLCMSPGTIVAGYEAGFIRAFSISNAEIKFKIETGKKAIVVIRQSAGHIVSGTRDGRVFIHEIATKTLVKQLNDHIQHCITNIDFFIGQNSPITPPARLWCVSRHRLTSTSNG